MPAAPPPSPPALLSLMSSAGCVPAVHVCATALWLPAGTEAESCAGLRLLCVSVCAVLASLLCCAQRPTTFICRCAAALGIAGWESCYMTVFVVPTGPCLPHAQALLATSALAMLRTNVVRMLWLSLGLALTFKKGVPAAAGRLSCPPAVCLDADVCAAAPLNIYSGAPLASGILPESLACFLSMCECVHLIMVRLSLLAPVALGPTHTCGLPRQPF